MTISNIMLFRDLFRVYGLFIVCLRFKNLFRVSLGFVNGLLHKTMGLGVCLGCSDSDQKLQRVLKYSFAKTNNILKHSRVCYKNILDLSPLIETETFVAHTVILKIHERQYHLGLLTLTLTSLWEPHQLWRPIMAETASR